MVCSLAYTIENKEEKPMHISYMKLWHLLLDRKMTKKSLREQTGISTASIAKLNKGENVTTDVLVRICTALNCDLTDIMELVPDENE